MKDKRSKSHTKEKKTCTYIGGQAVMEGVMMLGKTCMATAVRDEEGDIQVESRRISYGEGVKRAMKIPVLRGVLNMIFSLVRGMKALNRSAAVFGQDDEPSAAERWMASKLKVNLMDVVMAVSSILGVLIAVALFIVVPNAALSALKKAVPSLADTAWEFVLYGVFKLVMFMAYLGAILLMKSIRRLYQYHGAEHKTISCYEQGKELTPENVLACSRMHDRCGTSFLFIVLIINIVLISLIWWALDIKSANIPNNFLLALARIGAELVFLPLIAGVSYEFLRFFAKFDNWFVDIFKAPGKFIQKVFTTREPDREMVEVAIAAFKKVLQMDADPTVRETSFAVGGVSTQLLKATKQEFAQNGIDESDAEWIYSLVLDVPRSQLTEDRVVTVADAKHIYRLVNERLTGRPLWYIFGDTEFYGCTIKEDERVLIPRPETELLAEAVVKTAVEGDKILDLCTGSGCIAVSVAKHCRDKHVQVTASDISEDALTVARENAADNDVSVNFVQGDLFQNVHGRFNIIVCNPPYVPSSDIDSLQREVKDHEPHLALDGGSDGLQLYRRLAEDVPRYIAKGGMLMLECGESQVTDIINLFPKKEFAMVVKDYQGIDRFIKIAF